MIAYNYGGAYDQYTGYCASNIGYNTFSQQYWERSLFQRCKALFDFTGLPDAAQARYNGIMMLFCGGFLSWAL